MIYDCFTFFNELDLLEIRLNILNDVVDKFVLVEMNRTFSGKNKPLYYEENKERFSKFQDKIIHVIVTDCPESKDSWISENYQRNCIARGLKNCQPDDVILISDLDEIPNPGLIKNLDCSQKIYLLEQKMYYYFINYLDIYSPLWLTGTKVLSYQNFLHGLDQVKISYSTFLPESLNHGTTANKIRLWDGAEHIQNGGWHFSYLGGVEAIVKKIQSFSHQEFNTPTYLDKNLILKRIQNGDDLFNRKDHRYWPVYLDHTFPQYILDNQDKYKKLIFEISPRQLLLRRIKLVLKSILAFLYHKEESIGHQKFYLFGIKILSYKRK